MSQFRINHVALIDNPINCRCVVTFGARRDISIGEGYLVSPMRWLCPFCRRRVFLAFMRHGRIGLQPHPPCTDHPILFTVDSSAAIRAQIMNPLFQEAP